MIFNRLTTVLVLSVAIFSIPVQWCTAQQNEGKNKTAVRYLVDFSNAKNHYVNVVATIPVRAETTELMMAVWTPGSYLVREYARHIDSIEAKSGGKKLEFEKTRKNRWVVQTKGIKSFQLRYRLYCNEMTVRTNFTGNQYAMINGAPTFITVADRLDQKHIVRLKLPKPWKRSATSLRSTGKHPHTFVANDFDELVDSPIVAGNVQVYPFSAGGVEHQLVNVGESGQWNGTQAAADLKQVVQAHQEMWGTTPYDRYLFINMISDSRGGLEHDFSTLLMTSRWKFRDEKGYQDWLSLASHEFFHTWNVRRLRPEPLVEYDYETEIYTDVLWIAEGITSYYEDLALVRSGLIDQREYLARLSQNVEKVQQTDGRKVQSLRESSFDTWIKFYRPDENSINTRISYYSKGAVVAFLLDAKIRKLTDGEKCLDDVMRTMWEQHAQSGFTSKDFRKVASSVAGQDLHDWFSVAVDSTQELDYSDVEFLGVSEPNTSNEPNKETDQPASDSDSKSSGDEDSALKRVQDLEVQGKIHSPETPKEKRKKKRKKSKEQKLKKAQKKANKKSQLQSAGDEFNVPKEQSQAKPAAKPAIQATQPEPWLGIATSSADGKTKISRVTPDSPATDVGLNTGDEVIAINGYRVGSSVEKRLKQFEVGEELELLISRREQLMTIRVELGGIGSENWRLKFIAKPSDQQKHQRELWLGPAEL